MPHKLTITVYPYIHVRPIGEHITDFYLAGLDLGHIRKGVSWTRAVVCDAAQKIAGLWGPAGDNLFDEPALKAGQKV